VKVRPFLLCITRAEHFLLTSIVNYSWRVIFWTRPPGPLPFKGQRPPQRPGSQATTSISGRDVQAIFCRRRHQPSRPPPASLSQSSLVESTFFGQGPQPPFGVLFICAKNLLVEAIAPLRRNFILTGHGVRNRS